MTHISRGRIALMWMFIGLPVGVPAPDPASPGVDANWWTAATSQIAQQEYCASRNEHGFQAPNRVQNLRTYFGDGGIDIVPREGGAGAKAGVWRVTWRTSEWGRAGNMAPVQAAEAGPRAEGARVTYAWSGLDEWYENKPEGLEQGFTVRERRAGSGPLIVAGHFGGPGTRLRETDGNIDLLDESGARRLRYGALVARDASGCELPAHLRVDGIDAAIMIVSGKNGVICFGPPK